MALDIMSQVQLPINLIAVPTSFFRDVQITRFLKVSDDSLNRPLSDTYPRRDIAQPQVWFI